ncbi:Ig-like domain repeat protein, partial [Pseudomonas sp. CFBP 13602]|nr:Ig-like domain repeat protein [Pseudomonas sp. CFBP 13602]
PFWRVAGNADQAIPPITVSVAGEAQGAIPAPILAASLGKTAEVFYAVNQSGAVRPVSEVLSLQVLTLPANTLSDLQILEAIGGSLDVSALTDDATLRVGHWPLIVAGQQVWLTLEGYRSNGTEYNIRMLAPPDAVDSAWVSSGSKTVKVPVAELKALRHQSRLTVTFKVAMNGGSNEATATIFDSRAYAVVAVADNAPTISSVRDSWSEISPGGTTYDNSVTVSGTATASQQVELFDGATSKGNASVDTGGNWSAPLSGLALGTHSITAKGLYGNGLVSAARAFNKAAQTAPVISSVRDSIEEVPNGGTTPDLTVSISGTATPNTQVEIFDNGVISKGVAQVNATGNWTHSVSALAAGNHSLTAKALYGSGESSVAWGFVRADVPDWVKEDFELEQPREFQPYTNVRFRYFSSITNTTTSITGPASGLPYPMFSGRYFGARGHSENSSYYPVDWTFITPIKGIRFSLHLNSGTNECQVQYKDSSGTIMAMSYAYAGSQYINAPQVPRRIASIRFHHRGSAIMMDEITMTYR